jgi:hypothetical protein
LSCFTFYGLRRNETTTRPRYRWDENIEMDFGGIGCHGMDRIDLDQDGELWSAVVNMEMEFQVP